MSSYDCVVADASLQAERTSAAYLGFQSVVDLQRFVIMWPCLEAIRMFTALPGSTYESLVFPNMTDAPRSPRVTRYVPDCWIACILIVLYYNISVYELNTLEENRARTITAITSLSSHFWIPDHIVEEDSFPPSPIVRPILQVNEPWILPFHRCLLLLQYLSLTHGSEFQREAYLDARGHFHCDEFEVTLHDIPWWMRPST